MEVLRLNVALLYDVRSDDHMFQSMWLEHGLSLQEAELDLAILLPAGTETSITTIRCILMYLMISPRVYVKLRQEINQGIQQGRISRPVTNDEAKQLPYLQVSYISLKK